CDEQIPGPDAAGIRLHPPDFDTGVSRYLFQQERSDQFLQSHRCPPQPLPFPKAEKNGERHDKCQVSSWQGWLFHTPYFNLLSWFCHPNRCESASPFSPADRAWEAG